MSENTIENVLEEWSWMKKDLSTSHLYKRTQVCQQWKWKNEGRENEMNGRCIFFFSSIYPFISHLQNMYYTDNYMIIWYFLLSQHKFHYKLYNLFQTVHFQIKLKYYG